MFVIRARNAHVMLPAALLSLRHHCVERSTRNGPVLMFPEPTTLVYERPTERVIFHSRRDANPFFHLFESLWMLSGRNDVGYVASMVKQMNAYSDDGQTLNGAYGHRWRRHFGRDQIDMVISALSANPDDRRQVLQMWDGRADLGSQSKDVPCNIEAVFQVNNRGALDMTVYNRSNDLVWGAVGANVVHFSMLQEYIASSLRRPVGLYWQVSANMHVYTSVLPKVENMSTGADLYDMQVVQPFSLMSTDKHSWNVDLLMFMSNPPRFTGYSDPFFSKVALPMWSAYQRFKSGKTVAVCDEAIEILQQCAASDWRLAGEEWLHRRAAERRMKELQK